jgi:hypothetical protein
MTDDISLNEFARSEFSQSGEDGILEALFSKLGVSDGFFVEFGAWDGQHLSNTYRLVGEGWSGCQIEGDPERYQDLLANIPSDKIRKVCNYVAISGEHSLDCLLDQGSTPRDFDLLSIDIDSDDLAIWESLQRYQPKCVVIEYNPTIPFDVSFRNKPGKNYGNSAKAIDDFAQSNYVLVGSTNTNLIYLAKDHWQGSGIRAVTLADVEVSMRYFFGYDGTLFVQSGTQCESPEMISVPWTTTAFPQPIPKALRQFDRFQFTKMFLGGLTVALSRPLELPRVVSSTWKHLRRRSG